MFHSLQQAKSEGKVDFNQSQPSYQKAHERVVHPKPREPRSCFEFIIKSLLAKTQKKKKTHLTMHQFSILKLMLTNMPDEETQRRTFNKNKKSIYSRHQSRLCRKLPSHIVVSNTPSPAVTTTIYLYACTRENQPRVFSSLSQA